MFDDMFAFIDPIFELNEEGTSFVIQAETFFEFLEKAGLDKVADMPGGAKIEVPLDIVMSLLRPDELEKLQKYITAYLSRHGQQLSLGLLLSYSVELMKGGTAGASDRICYTGKMKLNSLDVFWNGDTATYAWTRRCVPFNDRTCKK